MIQRNCECGDTLKIAGSNDNLVESLLKQWDHCHSSHEQVSAEHCTNIRMYRKHTKGEDIV